MWYSSGCEQKSSLNFMVLFNEFLLQQMQQDGIFKNKGNYNEISWVGQEEDMNEWK